MNYRKFAIIILCVLYACLLSLALINIVVDPYHIFQTPFFKQQPQPNERYSKIEFLKKNKGRYNSYIMGSSRVGLTNTDIIEKYLPMAKFYNLSTALAVPYEHLLHLKYFIKNGYPVRNLYIGLDVDFCFGVKMHKDKDLLLKLHPGVLNLSRIRYYWSYLSVFPKTDIRRKLRLNFSRKEKPKVEWGENGALGTESAGEGERIFFEDPRITPNVMIENKVGKENLEVTKELVALCRQQNIHLILFITPHHKGLMDHFVEEDYLTFLKDLSEITPFWDFGGYNSITTNTKNYMDHSHYKSSVSQLMVARIFNDKTLTVPEDFGVWVTQENIDSHLESLKIAIKKNRAGNKSLNL